MDGRLVPQQVDLVHDQDDLFPPLADLRHELPFALGERAVGRGDEQHQVRAGDKALGQRLMLTDDRVGAGGVDDGDLVQKLGGVGALDDPIRQHRLCKSLPVAQEVDDRGGWSDALGHHLSPGKRIDERGLAGVELADDDEQEEFGELLRGLTDGVTVLRGGRVLVERAGQALEQAEFFGQEDVLLLGEDSSPTVTPVSASPSSEPKYASDHALFAPHRLCGVV